MSTESMTSASSHIYESAENENDRGRPPLVLGFAYSLTPDGAPGLYNQILAQTIISDWAGKDSWIGVQWEIRDAMADPQLRSNLLKRLRQYEPDTNALIDRLGSPPVNLDLKDVHAAPPCGPIVARKGGEDLVDWRTFRQRLMDSLEAKGDPAVAELARAVAATARTVGYAGTDDSAVLHAALHNAEQVAVYLNRLIQTEQNFHRRFWQGQEAMLELHDRQRSGFGPVGFERRELPASETELGHYQNQRVNTLIVEAICPERSVLPGPDYLSTRGVLQHLFKEMQYPINRFDRVFIYGSPVHSPRCKRQFIEFAWSMGWAIEPDRVTVIYCGDDMSDCGWIWDNDTAQVWCRSKPAWDAYETNNARLR